MSLDLFRSLSWLPAPPPDFSARCRAVFDQNSETAIGSRLQSLASYALDENQLNHLARAISKAHLDAYLASLQMEITFQPFDEIGRARITQLLNKSNQYNLTTKRYTEPEVAAAQHDPQCFTLQVRLSDSFGDNGMISAIICRQQSHSAWEIDTWLMSCCVLGRCVEQMVLREILEHARRNGIRKLIGTEAEATTTWELDVDTAAVEAAPMAVHCIGFMQENSDIAHE
jgi:FkbH-like protein